MFKISIIKFVFSFSLRLIIQFVFQNFNYYILLTMFSKTENKNSEKKILKIKKKLTDLIMREVQFMNDFDKNEKNSFRFVILFLSEFLFKKSKSSVNTIKYSYL